MEEFMKDLMSRRDELDGEIFEILLTFGDFLEFKQLMLSFKAVRL
jgi:ADP-ribosylation factor 2-binding protein